VLQRVATCCSVVQHVVVCYSGLQFATARCSALQCIAVQSTVQGVAGC